MGFLLVIMGPNNFFQFLRQILKDKKCIAVIILLFFFLTLGFRAVKLNEEEKATQLTVQKTEKTMISDPKLLTSATEEKKIEPPKTDKIEGGKPIASTTETSNGAVSLIGKKIAGTHPLKTLSNHNNVAFSYFQNSDVPNCRYTTQHTIVEFSWRKEGEIHYLPVSKFKIIEKKDGPSVPVAKFRWKVRGEEGVDKDIPKIMEENIIYIEITGQSGFWPFDRQYAENIEVLSSKISQKLKGMRTLEPLRNSSNTILSSNTYFDSFGRDKNLINAYSKIRFNTTFENGITQFCVIPCGKLKVKIVDNIATPVFRSRWAVLTGEGSTEKPITKILEENIIFFEVICTRDQWPFRYIPNGKYKKLTGEINVLLSQNYYLEQINPNQENTINPLQKYFDSEEEMVKFVLKFEEKIKFELRFPLSKFQVEFTEDKHSPIIGFNFKEHKENCTIKKSLIEKDCFKKNMDSIKIICNKKDWPF